MAKVLISMPDDLVREIDEAVAAGGTTRSAFIQEAARSALNRPSAARIDAALGRGREALAGTGAFETAALVREDRRARDAADRRR